MNTLWLIDDLPAAGAWNMAMDQALLEYVDEAALHVLRFYRWSPPTLSLGYFQKVDERTAHPASQTLEIVRRASGGGAIVHDQELTYSLIVPIKSRWAESNRDIYEIVHRAVIDSFARRGIVARLFDDCSDAQKIHVGPLLCFQRRANGDILIGNHKVGGSAQRRSRNALLQHGSILLRRSEFAPELPGVHELTGVDIDDRELAAELSAAISQAMRLKPAIFDFSPELLNLAKEIERQRFGADSWTNNR